jgi:two-component system, cell cycle sensor histidine kinase and response regulator CckA
MAAKSSIHERLELALEGAELGIWDWDLATGVVQYDERWASMLGYSASELVPTADTWKGLLHPDEREKVLGILQAHLEGRCPHYEIEHRLRHKNGSWVWVLSRGRVLERDPMGRPVRAAGTHLNITERKQEELARLEAEQEAHRRARDLEMLLKSMSNAFVVWRTPLDEHGHLTDFYFDYFNDAYERIAGVSLADVQGKSVREVWPETEPSWYAIYEQIARTGTPQSFEMRHQPTHGLYACNAYRLPHLEDRVCVAFEDVTDRRQHLVEMRNLAEQRDAILNAASVGITLLQKRIIQWCNAEFCGILGYRESELLGADARQFYVHQEDYERVGREGYACIGAGGVYSNEFLFYKKTGEAIWCRLRAKALEPTNIDKGSIWTFNDVNEQRLAEAALRESELRFKRLVQYSSDVIVVSDGHGVVAWASDSVTSTFGYQPSEWIGAALVDFVQDTERAPLSAAMADVIANPHVPQRVGFHCRHKAGHWVPLEVAATNFLDDVSVKGVVFNLRDISARIQIEAERHKLAEQLQQAMKMEAIGRLAGGIAHDFNNLLTAISGNLELASLEPNGSHGEIGEHLQNAQKAASSAAGLTRQLLAFSRRQMIEPKVLDLNQLVDNVRNLLARIIGEDVLLRTALGPHLPPVRVDPGQFEQVLVNLAVNARDAMPNGGVLLIETSVVELDEAYCAAHTDVLPGRYVLLAISDTGVGMDERTRQHLFEPFFTTKPKGRGTGLGLATIFGAIKQSGGSIEVYSELGKGSTFKVYLPPSEAKSEVSESSTQGPEMPLGSETILLIEDDSVVLNLSEAMLKRLGYHVLVAQGAAVALDLARSRRERIDLIFTDVVMPEMNGRDLSERLKVLHPEAKVLFASGYTENVIVHHGVVHQGTNFIGKPFSIVALAKKVRAALDASSPVP